MKIKQLWNALTTFERMLWLTSLLTVTAAFLLAPSKDYLTLTASLIGVTALIFIAKGYVIGQVLTVIFAVFYGLVSFYLHYYGEMITYLVMTAPIAILTVIAWLRHPYKDSSEVAVNRLTKRRFLILLVLTAIVTIGFFFILRALGNASLLFSTISVATSFLASALTLMRSEYYALAYAANDIVLIVLWGLATIGDIAYLPMVFCFLMFLLNDAYGFINWQRMRKRQTRK